LFVADNFLTVSLFGLINFINEWKQSKSASQAFSKSSLSYRKSRSTQSFLGIQKLKKKKSIGHIKFAKDNEWNEILLVFE